MGAIGKEITRYFRSVVAANTHTGIDFKVDPFYILNPVELINGQLEADVCNKIFLGGNKGFANEENKSQKDTINVLICAKTVKTVFEAYVKIQEEIEELTGLFFIPAILHRDGKLRYDSSDKKLPWFPREYLQPMVEPKLSVGYADEVDQFISNHVDRIEQLKTWSDYVEFFKAFYESITGAKFEQNEIPNRGDDLPIELESNVYLFVDNTVNSTYHVMNLYNHLLENDLPKGLYERFISTKPAKLDSLIENSLSNMKLHAGQMGGEFPLSPSQREAVNHFNHMRDGDILAVNGPPGTGKTTLLQSIVADMYVKRAIKKEKAPLIVATSTNNQAVTNIIASFGKINKVGLSNLEERWIEGVTSFATYFPSGQKEKEARNNGYQFTNSRGEHFVASVEARENLEKSKSKLLQNCNKYFDTEYVQIADCQTKLHEELLYFEERKQALLVLCDTLNQFECNGERIDSYLNLLEEGIEQVQRSIRDISKRVKEWEGCYKRIPFFFRWFSKRVQTEFTLFMNEEEWTFLQGTMKLIEIKEIYSVRLAECNRKLADLQKKRDAVKKWIEQYDNELILLNQHGIELHDDEASKYDVSIDKMNDLIDKKIRYVEFWLAVHYFECRWASGEDALTEKQVGKSFKNVLEKFYNRLAMITPCLVMTFFMLPKQFLAYGDQTNFFLYNYIDLLIVDEAGQVSPEIGAGAFALAKKAIVVGDVYQIEPVWSINRALDKALALSSGAIKELGSYEQLELCGLNGYGSSVMRVAAKSCRYQKYEERGLFLSEHRRCYNEIIDYCNKLVYKGNLEPKRGKGTEHAGRALKQWPQMGFRQINSENSSKQGTSRYNRQEAAKIAEWLNEHFALIQAAYSKEAEHNLIGIITPFKAQVRCIQTEIGKQAPHLRSKISVGTVHTFQGAERNVILMSTVYGRNEGCFFIDANKSLMNVAVSRAKDHFFVFGDNQCLKDEPSSASGLLMASLVGNSI
ncbi:AAA domain-containing protein [Brevibacillus formosus]|uniref:DEAD/DEAH box helicase n=1 Tax=Brevibacillus TaxID=55080 RepID=UPI000D1114A0|nr:MULTISPECIES: AAA domain-containing protein [Brevibacillus]MBG9943669.1 DNA helicase [Brevibacillus formosus]MED1948236.1 AAA domain-containing protein [Brevibacillus formosus]MED1998033.1 AAA domain-containing protein [Brevibacillus formosus]MED2080574.1 AAA domain-containing protein [Brevibacillus formosus]PSK13761.1 DNA helicase [Brevibacillus sp. NRRL NRS-603]